MWAEFDRLRRIWGERHEGAGGIAALAGFQFQFVAALLKLAHANAAQNRSTIFIEALSDIVSTEGGYLVVTQAKLTLRSGALQKALKELWEIDALAQTEAPTLVPHLRYGVLTSKKLLKDAAAALARWRPEHLSNEESLNAFRDRLSIREEPEPEMQLATYLVNAYGESDPFATIEKWLGRLLFVPTSAGFDEACRRIIVDLDGIEAAARRRAHQFYIWDTEDRPPSLPRLERDQTKATLTGQLPTRHHLLEGRFAPRSLYTYLHGSAEEWLSNETARNDGRLAVYWIAGRSGAGKSVALLHLLAELHATDDRRIIVWLDQQADRLAEAVRWARPFFAKGRDVIFASDDPYTPERHQRVATSINDSLREIDAIAIAHPNMKRPAVIFCGPPEQSQYFEDDLADRVIIERFSVPDEPGPDVAELRDWYQQRTGKTTLAINAEENILIVQLFFEWATGAPIREFAQRFRQRLEGMARQESERSIFDIVAEILALNRLYALYPAKPIDDELENNVHLGRAFDRLKDMERHLSFDSEMEAYRLTHPHLANALYTTWFGRAEDRRARKTHLRAGIIAAISCGDSPSRRLAPLWAIVRLGSPRRRLDTDAAERLALIEPELRELLIEIYQTQFTNSKTPLTDFPVWTDLDRQFSLGLQPSPIALVAAATRSANPPAPGLRLCCHKLLQHRDIYAEGPQIVSEKLDQHRGWHEWPPLTIDYLALIGFTNIENSLTDFVAREWVRSSTRVLIENCFQHSDRSAGRRVILSWLCAASIEDPTWPGRFTEFVDSFQFCETSCALAQEFLVRQRDHSSWSHVWERLHASSMIDHLISIDEARSWIQSARPDISGWTHVWQKLWQASFGTDGNLRTLGFIWLDQAQAEHKSWSYVWDELWLASGKSDADLHARGLKWLDDVPADHRSWSFIWLELWQATGKSANLSARGLKWLDEAPADHGAWTFVWRELWQDSGKSNTDLHACGLKWLDKMPTDHGSWSFVWRELWQASGKCDTDLQARGLKWLDEMPADHGSWQYVWEELWQASGKFDTDLQMRGLKWLDKAPADHGSWKYVWEKLWQASGKSDTDLQARGLKWLNQAPADHGSWKYVWEELWLASGRSDAGLQARGLKWLDEAPADHGSWKYVWEELWLASGKSDIDLQARGLKWLDKAPADHGSWKYVWEELWQASGRSDTDLQARGLKWLDKAPADHGSWKYVWEELWQASGRSDTDLQARGLKWLDEAPADHGSWAFMWLELWRASNKSNADLRERGEQWLDRVSIEHRSWGFVWRELWRVACVENTARSTFLSKAINWLHTERLNNTGWPIVWNILWDTHIVDKPKLVIVAAQLLISTPPKYSDSIRKRIVEGGMSI